MSVNLECYYQGSYTYEKNWDIKVVDLKLKNSDDEISAHINTSVSTIEEQRLTFTLSKKGNSIFKPDFRPDRESEAIECPISLLKSMEISARIFQTYENRSVKTRQFDGSYDYEMRSRRDNLPVFIDKLPDFEPSETYQIRIINQDNTLRATITKKVSEVATPKFSEKKKSQSTSQTSAEGLDQLDTAFEGLGRMMGTASSHNQALDGLETLELQNRLEQTNQKLIAARLSFDRACQSGIQSQIMAELSAKQQIMQEVISLQRALQSRGIPQRDLSSQECIVS